MHFLSLFLALMAFGAIPSISGSELFTQKPSTFSAQGKKGLVVVFLSAACPCSDSHRSELADLVKDFPDFQFVGVHSNSDESKEATLSYFTKTSLPLPLIQDSNDKIADEFKALKTPHAFVLRPDGNIAYRGGISSGQIFDPSKRKYLREALEDVQNGTPVRTPEARTLGCVIVRGDKNAW